MTMFYFQVPDTQTGGFGNDKLKLLGAQDEYAKLCGLLHLKANARPEQAYAKLSAFQRARGLIADGMAGPYNLALLDDAKSGDAARNASARWLKSMAPERLTKIFPYTLRMNLQIYAPYVFAALDAAGYTPNTAKGKVMCQLALATIRAESEGFEPIAEARSMVNSAPGRTVFGLYDAPGAIAKRLGNTQPGDGAAFKGRGFVQLTGRGPYAKLGAQIGLPLEQLPHLANLPEAAAVLLVQCLQNNETKLLAAMQRNQLAAARKLVSGGSHGLERFKDACKQFSAVLAPNVAAASRSSPRGFNFARFTDSKKRFSLPVRRDRVDLRDLPYRPPLGSLSAEYPAPQIVREYWRSYRVGCAAYCPQEILDRRSQKSQPAHAL